MQKAQKIVTKEKRLNAEREEKQDPMKEIERVGEWGWWWRGPMGSEGGAKLKHELPPCYLENLMRMC